ncbi:2389_t:CDS:2 [Scutellospora calospora]|uniref:2389_t:CDS:1 n=1 Tax=Scutellospora calospora TaxID=85575 RepID=A0ACA9JU69_9GLOM|nr:2389_t:CDS:2 [Scutellospora calospora]
MAFASALIGVFLFLIFGTNRRAAVFLPCCYYTPSMLPTQQESLNDSGQNNYVLETLESFAVNLPEDVYNATTKKI